MSDLLAGMRNGAWLDAQHFPPLAYAVPGLFPEGFVLHVGAPKAGKSWLVLAIGLAVAVGGVVLGRLRVGKRAVLYLALEDGDRRLQDRCRKLLGRAPIPPNFDYFTRVAPGEILATIREWLELHKGEATLVILDTLGKCMPPALPGESAYQRDYRIGSALMALCAEFPGLVLVVNHHDRKAAAEDFIDAVSATHGLAGAADTTVVLCRDRMESAGLLKVTGRDVPEGEYAVTFRDGHYWALDGAGLTEAAQNAERIKATTRATGAASDRMIDIVLLAYQRPEGIRRADVVKALGIDEKQATVYLGRAVELGRLKRAARGLYIPVTSVTSDGGDTRGNTDNTGLGEQGTL